MKPKTYKLLEQCVEHGIMLGMNRAHKHTEYPTETQLHQAMFDAIMFEISEWFDFDEAKE